MPGPETKTFEKLISEAVEAYRNLIFESDREVLDTATEGNDKAIKDSQAEIYALTDAIKYNSDQRDELYTERKRLELSEGALRKNPTSRPEQLDSSRERDLSITIKNLESNLENEKKYQATQIGYKNEKIVAFEKELEKPRKQLTEAITALGDHLIKAPFQEHKDVGSRGKVVRNIARAGKVEAGITQQPNIKVDISNKGITPDEKKYIQSALTEYIKAKSNVSMDAKEVRAGKKARSTVAHHPGAPLLVSPKPDLSNSPSPSNKSIRKP